MKYKILIILTRAFDPNKGGVQRSTYKISSYLKNNGHHTHIFSYKKEGNKPCEVAKLHTVDVSEKNITSSSHNKLEKIVKKIKPNIVINQMPYERGIGLTLMSLKGQIDFLLLGCLRNSLFSVKLNLSSYMSTVIPKFWLPLMNNAFGKNILLSFHKYNHKKNLKFILDTYDYFVMFGPPNIRELKYFVGEYKLNKTYLIPNSILSVVENVPVKEKRILFLSRVSYRQKKADLILPFWKRIMHELPEWELDIVGDGDALEDIISQVQDEEIPRVNIYGRQTPYKYYERAPIYIMTSEFEGFPNTLIEAQSFASIPVVYDSYPICSWVVNDNKDGILIPPFNIDKMSNEVLKLAKDSELREKMMNSCLQNARKFELQSVGKIWTDFFDKELNGK